MHGVQSRYQPEHDMISLAEFAATMLELPQPWKAVSEIPGSAKMAGRVRGHVIIELAAVQGWVAPGPECGKKGPWRNGRRPEYAHGL